MRPLRRIAAASLLASLLAALLALAAFTHARRQAPAPTTLAGVLSALDAAADGIHAVSARVSVADYTALVDDTTRSSGVLYFKRTKQGPMYALDLTSPAATAKQLVYRDQTAWIFTPASKQVEKFALGDQQALVNQFLLIGMGSTGDDLTRSFKVAFDGAATVAGAPTVKLTLTPLDQKLSGKLTHIDLWYDTRTWIAAQQQLWQLGGDYHLVRYTDVKRDPRLDDALFSTNFPGATVVIPKP